MTTLSGHVAVLDPAAQTVRRVMDLGPEPIEVKPYVRRLVGPTEPPAHDAAAEVATLGYKIEESRVIRVWTISPRPFTEADYAAAVQDHIDATARSRGYADGVSLASYAGDTEQPAWAAEAAAFISWRSRAWAFVYAQQAQVIAGERSQPTPTALVAELPTISWPQ